MSTDEVDIDTDGCGVDAAPYVLGALSEAEVAAFCMHLTTCAVCREEVAVMGAVVATLPAVAPQVSAPVDLKRRVMGTVQREASLHATPALGASATSAAHPRARAWLGWRPALAGASLVAAAAALVAIAIASGRSGSSVRTIRAEVLAPRASATVRVSDGHAVLNIAGMPQTTPDRVYEVWILRTRAPQPTDALFTVSRAGNATVGVPGALDGVKEILVTSEPRGGSPAPTRTPVIVAHVS
ncbi:MAG TPA: anti-sigma factor [Solirubrobacteraceae bacterium]|nr:anti-sigma factor [Solirubrobacteraceae bacterium]